MLQNSSTIDTKLKLCLWNAQSLRSKTHMLKEFRTDHDIDLFLITESWITDEDQVAIGELECQGECTLFLKPRLNRTGGGVACLAKSGIKVSKIDTPETSTFEHLELQVTINGAVTTILIIYRPEPSRKNPYIMSEFFSEFNDWLSMYNHRNNEILIVGDFNIHINKIENPRTQNFCDIIETFGMKQHIKSATHKHGNTLDLIITKNKSSFDSYSIEDLCSDHHCIIFQMNLTKPRPTQKIIKMRNTKELKLEQFAEGIENYFRGKSEQKCDSIEELNRLVYVFYGSKSVLDNLVPEKDLKITIRNKTPWSNQEIKKSKLNKRKKEKGMEKN